jgi:hypothetical protein
MSSSQTSVILVAGAWHTAFHGEPIRPFLERNGYHYMPVQLESSKKTRPSPEANWVTISQHIKSEVALGRKVCIIGHSVAGMSVVGGVHMFLESATADEASKLVNVSFLASFLNPARTLDECKWYTVDYDRMEAILVVPVAPVFYNDMLAEEAQPFVDALESSWVAPPPDHQSQWWARIKKEVPSYHYFLCTKDMAIPPKFQYMEAAEIGATLVELDMDHCPIVSRPKEFVDELCKVLSSLP